MQESTFSKSMDGFSLSNLNISEILQQKTFYVLTEKELNCVILSSFFFFLRAHRLKGIRKNEKKRKLLPNNRNIYSKLVMDSSDPEAVEKMSNSWGTLF